jgi:hypothetical protein
MHEEMIEIRTAIPAYPGHADAHARRLADQQVRAWVGERLAALRERLPIPPDLAAAFEDLLFHCQFGDQHVIKALEDDRFAGAEHVAVVEAEDAKLLGAAVAADRVDAAGLPAFQATLQAAFTERTATIVALKR